MGSDVGWTFITTFTTGSAAGLMSPFHRPNRAIHDNLGLRRVRAFTAPGHKLGLFGSGCDEYVYARSRTKRVRIAGFLDRTSLDMEASAQP